MVGVGLFPSTEFTATLINVDGGLHTHGMPNSAAAFLVVTSYNVVSQRRP
jgi:hypothetical protein